MDGQTEETLAVACIVIDCSLEHPTMNLEADSGTVTIPVDREFCFWIVQEAIRRRLS